MKFNLKSLQRIAEAASLIGARASYDSYKRCTVSLRSDALRIIAMTPEATLIADAAVLDASATICAQHQEPVDVSVRTVDLYEALRNLTGDTVDIVKAATHLRIKWAKGVYKLPVGAPTLQFEEPPRQEPDAYCQMPSAEFHDLLQQVTYWDVTEDDKAYTDVVSFERYKGDQVSVVQCGARMLNHVGITVPTTVQVNQFCLSILSSRLLKKIALLMPGTVSWRTSGRDIEVSFDGLVRIYALGVAVPFPQWRALMPRGGFKWVTVAQRDLQEALRRVAQFEHVTAVFNIIDENLGIRFLTEAGVSGDESIHVQSSTITPTDVIRLPADALYRAVCQHAAGTNVRLRIWGEGSPVVLDSSDNYMQMLAQMRF